MTDIYLLWEKFTQTTTGKVCLEHGFQNTTAVEFGKYIIKRLENGKER